MTMRYLRIMLIIVVVLVASIWLTFPWWAPGVARAFLPDGWSLHSLDIGRPGFRGIRIDEVEARGNVVGLPLDIAGSGLQMTWRDPVYEIADLTVGLSLPGGGGMGFPGIDALRMPRLLIPVDVPNVRIGHLTIEGLGGVEGPLEFTDLHLQDQVDGPVELATGVDTVPGFYHSGHLELQASRERFHVLFAIADGDDARVELTQAQMDGALQTVLDADLTLEAIDPALLAEFLGDRAVNGTGRMQVQVTFSGPVPQRPSKVRITVDGAELQDGDTTLGADVRAEATIEGATAVITLSDPARLEVAGQSGTWPSVVASLFEGLGLTLPPPGADRLSARLDAGAGTRVRLGLDRPWPLAFEGNLGLRLEQADHSALSLALGGALLAVDGLAPMSPFDLSAPVVWEARLAGPLTMALEDGTIDLAGIESRGSGEAVFSASALRALNAPDLQAKVAATSLVFEDSGQTIGIEALDAAGALEVAADGPNGQTLGWAYSGPLTGATLALDTTDPEGLRLDAGAFAAELRAEARGEALLSSGEGHLEAVSLPGMGIEALLIQGGWDGLDLGALTGDAWVNTTGLAVTIDEAVYSGFDVDATAHLAAGGPVTGDGTVRIGQSAALPFQYSADLESGVTSARMEGATLAASSLSRIAQVANVAWPEGATVSGGELILDGEATLAETLTGALTVRGDGIEAGYGESRLTGARVNLEFDLAEAITGAGSLTAARAALAAGLDVTSLTMDVELTGDADIIARNITGTLFEGALYIPESGLAEGVLMPTTVGWTGFDLARLLAFVDVPGLEGGGTMNASLPVRMQGEGLTVADGTFEATSTGRIAYSGGGPATNIGLQALENFHYDTFSGTIDYDPAGPYAVRMNLLGRNPDLYGGHPVKFGLNLGGEMPAVFKSLFLTGSFEEALLQSLRESNVPIP